MPTLISIMEDSPLFSIIGSYLNIKDIENIFYLNKKICKNKNNKLYTRLLIRDKGAVKIVNFFKRSICIFRYIEKINFEKKLKSTNLIKKITALYYFKYYDKESTNYWYNIQIQWKKDILDQHGRKNIENPTKYDLFNLMKVMNPNDVFTIGW